MNFLNRIWGIGLLAFLLATAIPGKSKAQDISSQDFYDNLSPYGTWVSDPRYGDVWVPDAEDGFRPYGSRGHWVLTDYGNTWVSDYPWGWLTFHYGRWHYDDYYGWEWIPGYEWAPAWVSWREGGGYYGWAPLMPGISLSLFLGGRYHIPDRYWVCAPQAYINSPVIYNYYVPHTKTVTIIHATKTINNTYVSGNHKYIAGPRLADIQRVTHQKPPVYHISNATTPGAVNVHNNAVTIFRPSVKKAPGAHPARVVDGAAYRKQNPNQGIAHAGPGGAAALNHANAAKLATVARSSTPDNKVVHINPHGNPAQPASKPIAAQPNTAAALPAKTRGGRSHNRGGQPAGPPVQAAPATQQQPAAVHTQPAPSAQPQPANGQNNGKRNHNRQNATPPANPANQPVQAAPVTPPQPATNTQPAPAAQPQPAGRLRTRRPENRPNIAPPANQPAPQRNAQHDNNAQQQAAQQAQKQQQQAQQAAQQAQQAAQQAQKQQQQAQQAAHQAQKQQQQAAQQEQRQQAAQQAQQQQRQAQPQPQPQPRPTPQPRPQAQPRPVPPPRQAPPPQKPPEEHKPPGA